MTVTRCKARLSSSLSCKITLDQPQELIPETPTRPLLEDIMASASVGNGDSDLLIAGNRTVSQMVEGMKTEFCHNADSDESSHEVIVDKAGAFAKLTEIHDHWDFEGQEDSVLAKLTAMDQQGQIREFGIIESSDGWTTCYRASMFVISSDGLLLALDYDYSD